MTGSRLGSKGKPNGEGTAIAIAAPKRAVTFNAAKQFESKDAKESKGLETGAKYITRADQEATENGNASGNEVSEPSTNAQSLTSPRSQGSNHVGKVSSDDLDVWIRKREISIATNAERPHDLQGKVREFTDSTKFVVFVTTVIVINAIYIGLETELNTDDTQADKAWFWCEFCFTAVFTCELALRWYGHGKQFLKDSWNLFDGAIVATGIVDTFVIGIMVNYSTSRDENAGALDVLTAMRIARLLRVARIIRLMRLLRDLWLLVSGVLSSLRTLVWAWALIAMLVYIFGIFATRLLGQTYGCSYHSRDGTDCDSSMDEYFGTVPKSMFSLFQVLTTEGWAEICEASMRHQPSMWIFFVLFISITTFAIMNVITAVIVENTLTQADSRESDIQKKIEADRKNALSKIYEVFKIADVDGDAEISKDEFLNALQDNEVRANMMEVEIDMRGAEGLFDILDYDGSGKLDTAEFIEGCMRARGEAKAKDVLAVQCDLWRTKQWVQAQLEQVENSSLDSFEHLEEIVAGIKRSMTAKLEVAKAETCQKLSMHFANSPRRSKQDNDACGPNSQRGSNAQGQTSPRQFEMRTEFEMRHGSGGLEDPCSEGVPSGRSIVSADGQDPEVPSTLPGSLSQQDSHKDQDHQVTDQERAPD